MGRESEDRLSAMVRGKRVLFVSVKGEDYIRIRQLRRILDAEASSVRILSAGNRNPLLRFLAIRKALIGINPDAYDVIVCGFLPQAVLPALRRRSNRARRQPCLVADFFVSVYDTLCLDRRMVRPHSLFGRLLRRLDERTLAAADLILTDTASDAAWFTSALHADPARMQVLYLEADSTIYGSISGDRTPTVHHHSQRSYRVLYFGTGLKLQGIHVVLEAARIVARRVAREKDAGAYDGNGRSMPGDTMEGRVPAISFTLIGLSEDQRRQAAAIPGCHVIPWLPQSELAKEIAGSDLCLAGHFAADNDKARRVIPGKAFIYEAMGKEMILGDAPGNHERFSEDARHHFVPMGDPETLADRILACAGGRASDCADPAASPADIPSVSVILPVYNNGTDLERCMESLFAQTLPAQQIELILVDDGSADATAALCDAFTERNSRVRAIHQPNAGAPAARNTGLQAAGGKWIAFVDPDDSVEPDFLRLPLEAGERDCADVVLFDGVRSIPETGRRTPFVFAQEARVMEHPEEILELCSRTLYEKAPANGFPYPLAAPWNKLYRRSFLSEHGLTFPQELRVLDDMAFLFKVFACAGRVSYVHASLYTYVYHAGTVSTKIRQDRAALDLSVFRYLQDQKEAWERGGRIDRKQAENLTQALYGRIVKSFAICCKSSFFNEHNPAGQEERMRAAREALREPLRRQAFRNVALTRLEWRLVPVVIAGRMGTVRPLALMTAMEKKVRG